MLATIVNMMPGWRCEVIDEENYSGPRGKDGLPDHEALQKENPADVVGFYCGMTSTMPRVWKLASFYKSKKVATLAGSWHAHYCPEETLRHDIDLVVHGDAELVIGKILTNLVEGWSPHREVGGVSFLKQGAVRHKLSCGIVAPEEITDGSSQLNLLENRLTNEEMSQLPYPDFRLVKYAHIRIIPIGMSRGCAMACEFCTVSGAVRSASPEWLFNAICYAVETIGAKSFFIVDDRLESDRDGALKAFKLVAGRFGRKLSFNVQMRLNACEDKELMEAACQAGVRSVCIGLESPIQAELDKMKKGQSGKKMANQIKKWRGYGIRVHGMFIFGFPTGLKMSIKERVRIYKRFIAEARLDFVQILLPIPLIGSELRRKLEANGQLFPLEISGYEMYDGNFVLIKPDEGIDIAELQSANVEIMDWFYGLSIGRIAARVRTFLEGLFVWGNPKSAITREVILWLGRGVVKRWRATNEDKRHIAKLRSAGC